MKQIALHPLSCNFISNKMSRYTDFIRCVDTLTVGIEWSHNSQLTNKLVHPHSIARLLIRMTRTAYILTKGDWDIGRVAVPADVRYATKSTLLDQKSICLGGLRSIS